MADGSYKPIEAIQVGDLVMSFERLGKLVPNRVSKLFVHLRKKVVEMGGIRVTTVHRFLQPDGDYRRLGELTERDHLVKVNGSFQVVGKKKNVRARFTVYNFSVENLHTYVAGGFRVHNVKTAP